MELMAARRLMVAVTGASGAAYAKGFLGVVWPHYDRIYLTASKNSSVVLSQELGVQEIADLVPEVARERLMVLDPNDLTAPPASGSHDYQGLVIIPCSMGTVGRIAAGTSSDLITRAADVCLKEKRKLILVVRETPFSLIHLRNLTTLAEAGATIMPAAPAFYNKPERISDLIDFMAARVMQHLGIEQAVMAGWKE